MGRASLHAKLKAIILPSVRFSNAMIEETVENLRIKSRDLDTTSYDVGKKKTLLSSCKLLNEALHISPKWAVTGSRSKATPSTSPR
jgi:hypothetical protein